MKKISLLQPKKIDDHITYGRQDINHDDIQAVIEVLKSDFLTQGPITPAFEKAISDYVGAAHVVAVNSATSALHIACLALGVKKGDLVWTSAITFAASSNCALYCGASVDFVDIDPFTYNMSVEVLKAKLRMAKKIGKLPKVVIPVHFCGQPCDMEGIHLLSREYGFSVIEDASHAIGGRYKSNFIGGSQFSDITVFSFHPVKIITSGEGGAAVTNNLELARSMRLLRSHGITSNTEDMVLRSEKEIWNYQQIQLGFNYRMTDILAALGLSQMSRLEEFVKKRNELAKRYDKLLADLPIVTPRLSSECYSSYHLYIIKLDFNKTSKNQREIYNALRANGILVNLHYIPVYRHPFYESMGFKVGHCPEAESFYHGAISIPMYATLTIKQQDRVVSALKLVFDL